MRFLVDNQLPLALAQCLRAHGYDCSHVFEAGLEFADDLTIWKRCLAERRIVISKDEDFVYLANRPGDTGLVIWVRLGNCRNPVLLHAFDDAVPNLDAAFRAGERIVEIR